ncbi:MAG: hypothetical protein QM537_09615 [Candidatus Symbiobacter sp.]|nr:hypothetical protein [Candidatus Symbiobacter sp.]
MNLNRILLYVSPLFGLMFPAPAFAHMSEKGFVLLLPTQFAIMAGGAIILLSFLLLTLVPNLFFEKLFTARLELFSTQWSQNNKFTAILSDAYVAVSIKLLILWQLFALAPTDTNLRPLPLIIWVAGWIITPILTVLFGNIVLAKLNLILNPDAILFKKHGQDSIKSPFTLTIIIFLIATYLYNKFIDNNFVFNGIGTYGLLIVLAVTTKLPKFGHKFPINDKTGYLIASILFFGFSWFELISPYATDNDSLALAVAIYLFVTIIMTKLWGRVWLDKCDPFMQYLRFLAAMSPFMIENGRVKLCPPGLKLARMTELPMTGVFFITLTVAALSFDAWSQTFTWLNFIGINPLEPPGRTALIPVQTLGFVALSLIYFAVFCGIVSLGRKMGGSKVTLQNLCGRLCLSLIPISVAFHFAHYAIPLLVQGQNLGLLLNDPLNRGWNLLGLRGFYVTTSFLMDMHQVTKIWLTQIGLIIIGHVVAVVLAHHALVTHRAQVKSMFWQELPLALTMVVFTMFGLWLLSTPSA